MNKENLWRMIVVGGASNGHEWTFSSEAPIVVGRSHTANVRLSKSDLDVSGRHAEFSMVDGVAQVVNLSSTRPLCVNGKSVAQGKSAIVRSGFTVELGGRVRIRLDAVPNSGDSSIARDEQSTIVLGRSTEATRFLDGDGSLDVPTAVMEEATVTGTGEEAFAEQTFSTRVPENSNSTVDVPEGGTIATRVPDETVATHMPDSALSPDMETETGGDVSDEGQTIEAKTRVGSWEEIQAMKDSLDRKRKMHRVAILFGFVLIMVALVAVYFITGGADVETAMEWPKSSDGSLDIKSYALRNEEGSIIIKVDYPDNPNITETISPDNSGVTVLSSYGKRRDVPYFLQFEAQSNPEELHMDLMTSIGQWFKKAMESGEGFVFDERTRDELKPKFFEDVYPGSCQAKTLYGVRFLEFEYKRTWPQDGKLWHGWAHYFRLADKVYILRREIPEFYWERGGYRIKQDPNIAIYSTFSDAYWESPGDSQLANATTGELMDMIRAALAKERAGDWRLIRRDIDTVLARSWRTDPKTRELAQSCLRQYRDILRVYYNGKYNAFLTAKDNREEKKMRLIRKDAQVVFCIPDERYYFLVNNGEVW